MGITKVYRKEKGENMDFKREEGIIYLGENKNDKYAYITWKELGNGVIEVDHTVVDKEYGGQGIAAKLVDEVVKYAKENNLKISSTCWYASKRLKDEKYKDIIA